MLTKHYIILLLSLVLGCASCQWHEAEAVIAMADSIDQTQHVIYDDTAALGLVIRQLDNPMGRVFKHSTLGKAYYYMGRNLEDNYQQIAEAAECYIEADRLQIDDPIYRGRVNSCMGYICKQISKDSLALIFYERASDYFKESMAIWYIAQNVLDLCDTYLDLGKFDIADSLLLIAQTYQLDSVYQASYCLIRGLYYCKQNQLDSALIYFNQGSGLWNNSNQIIYCYLKIMQVYDMSNRLAEAIPYAHFLVKNSDKPNHLVNAYYCLMQEAKLQNNTEALAIYASARADAQKILRNDVKKTAEAIPLLEDYANNPKPWRWVWVSLTCFLLLCILLVIILLIYRKKTSSELHIYEQKTTDLSVRLTEQETLLTQHKYNADLTKILKKYPTPPNRWNEYSILKKDVEPYLYNWLIALEQLGLTNREKVFCVFIFVYRHFTIAKIADYMNNTDRAVRVLKTRLSQKLGISSVQLIDYLQDLHLRE